jgi:hypothetical protein
MLMIFIPTSPNDRGNKDLPFSRFSPWPFLATKRVAITWFLQKARQEFELVYSGDT